MSASASKTCALVALLLAAACGPPAEYRFGRNVTGMLFSPTSATEGIHPDRSVLVDPHNPFLEAPLGPKTKWQFLESAGSVAAFYAFATALAQEPIGENQFYVGQTLAQTAQANALASPDAKAQVLQMAITAYQSVLDHFPDSVSYDATGTSSFRLATPAYKAIVALGGKVQGDWLLVTTATGGQEAVHSARVATDGGP